LHAEEEKLERRALHAGRRLMFGEAWDKNLTEIVKHGPIHLVGFTGDLAQGGKANEYKALMPLLDRTLDRLGLDYTRLFVVPGNHDIDRAVAKTAWKTLREADWNEGDALSRWLAGGSPLPRIKKTLADDIFARQSAYRAWVKDTLRRPELLSGPDADHPRLGYRVKLDGFPFPLHIVGFDSAWLAGPGVLMPVSCV
jgi:Calcineurin-like phosphoesterase